MAEVRDELKGIHGYLEMIFNYYYVESKLSHQNDSVFNDIIDSVKYALRHTFWPHKHEGEILQYKIDLILERWKRDRDVLRARGAGMNYEAIRHMEKEVLAILEKA